MSPKLVLEPLACQPPAVCKPNPALAVHIAVYEVAVISSLGLVLLEHSVTVPLSSLKPTQIEVVIAVPDKPALRNSFFYQAYEVRAVPALDIAVPICLTHTQLADILIGLAIQAIAKATQDGVSLLKQACEITDWSFQEPLSFRLSRFEKSLEQSFIAGKQARKWLALLTPADKGVCISGS